MNILFADPRYRLITALLFGTLITRIAFFLTIPFLAIYLVLHVKISIWLAGVIISLSPLASIIGGFAGGQLSDLLGRRLLMDISLYGTALILFGFFYLVYLNYPSITFNIICYSCLTFAIGFLSSIFHPVSQAIISDVLEPQKRLFIFQIRYTMINLGVALGPVLGAITGVVGGASIFFIGGIIYLLYAICNTYLSRNISIPNFLSGSNVNFLMTLKVIAIDKKLQYFVMAGILFFICYAQVESTLSQYLSLNFKEGVKLFAYLLATNGFAVVAFQAPVYYITKRCPVNLSLIVGSVILAFGFVCFALAHQPWEFYLGMVIASIGELFVLPVSSLFIDMIAPEEYKGTYFGASMLRQTGIFVGPILGSALLQHFGGRIMFLVMAIFTALSCLLNLLGEKIKQTDHQIQRL